MSDVLQFALLGLGPGAIYGLLALGLVAIYRGAGILNLAHGALATSGGYAYIEFQRHNVPPIVAVVGAVAVSALIGAAIHVLIMRRLRNATALVRLIATLGILVVLQQVALLRYGGSPLRVNQFLPNAPVNLPGGVVVGADRLLLVLISMVVASTLWLVFRYTRFGKATTAAVENQQLAAARGWSPDYISTVNWTLGGALGGLAGCLVIPLSGLQPNAGALIVLPALAAALLASFKSFPLALAAGLGIGIAESEVGRFIPIQGVARSLPFLVIAVMLSVTGRSLPLRGSKLELLPIVDAGRLRTRRVLLGALVFGAVAWTTFGTVWIDATTTMLVTAIVLVSIVILTGYAGQLSLGQYAFAGLGALIAGRLVATASLPFGLALIIGVAATVPIGVLFAVPALRTRGVNLAIVTFGLGLSVWLIVFNNTTFTGGQAGTQVGSPHLFGMSIDAIRHPERYMVFCLTLLVIVLLVTRNLRNSPVGRRLLAVRSSERAAASLGISVFSSKMYAFALAAAVAALGGVAGAFRSPSIVFRDFDPFSSINAVLLAVIGGVGAVTGPLWGMTLANGGIGSIVRESLSSVERYITLVSALLLLITLIINQNGLAIAAAQMTRSLRSRNRVHHSINFAETFTPPAADVSRHQLEVCDIKAVFGGVVAVDGVTFSVRPGEIVGLIGPNGAGKTTVVDIITGFTQTRQGSVLLDDQDVTAWSPARRANAGIRRSFQESELFEDMTVLENVLVGCEAVSPRDYLGALVHVGRPQLASAASSAITDFRLEETLEKLPSEVSFGDRRLVSIARTVASSPSILLLDEPAAGLDFDERAELGVVIRRIAHQQGMGVLLIEHDIDLVLSVCDRVVVLNFGQVIAAGTPDEVRHNQDVIDAYLGDSVSPEEKPVSS